jgi:hypothetical protein
MPRLPTYGIKTFYTTALAECLGMETAYTYFAKRLVLTAWLRGMPPPRRILVAGLPEKSGVSLDFVLLAHDLSADVLVVDERPAALQRLQEGVAAWGAAQSIGEIPLRTRQVHSLAVLAELAAEFDLVLSAEVVQRLPAPAAYVRRLGELCTAVAIFCPNADNPACAERHALSSGMRLETLETLVAATLHKNDAPDKLRRLRSGFIDMPLFSPGTLYNQTKRKEPATGSGAALAMRGLGCYARLEKFLPTGIRRRRSRLVFCLTTV